MSDIISAAELAGELASSEPPTLLDVRWQLGGPPGRPEYEEGHLPGAVHVDLETELADPHRPDAGRHPLPSAERFGEAMRRAGVRQNRPVVTYDAGGPTGGWAAARAWWLLRWAGHREVRVLDGGLAAWRAHGGELTTAEPNPPAGDFLPLPGSLSVLDTESAAALARRGVLLDARAAERYRGEVEPLDPAAGHIPGAVSAPTTENVTDAGTFRTPQALAERFEALGVRPGTEVGVYCGSGVSAAHEVLALRLAGVQARLYPGSWSEWSSEPNRPVATGPERG